MVNHRTLKAVRDLKINGLKAKALMNTGSFDCYINRNFAEKHSLVIQNFAGEVTLAETLVRMPVFGQCFVNLYAKGNEYNNVAFNVLNNLSTDVIIGEKIFQEHKKVFFNFDGSRSPLMLNALSKMAVPYPRMFSHLVKNCRPIADKTQKYLKEDADFYPCRNSAFVVERYNQTEQFSKAGPSVGRKK